MNFFGRNNNNAADTYVDGLETKRETLTESTPAQKQPAGESGLEVTVVNPTDFSEVTTIASQVMRGITVIMNLDRMNKESSRRILDFLGGVVYSMDGGIKKVAATAYILTPRNVDVYDTARSTNLETGINRENIGGFDN